MPNLPISGLPASSTLQGDELFADVQGGVTKYTTLDDVTNYVTSSIDTYHQNNTDNSYLVPVNITCQDLDEIHLTSSAYLNTSMFKLTWTGDTGTMNMYLPDATLEINTYRTIRFITNGTYSTSTRTELQPSGSQTLDGGVDADGKYTINKAYEGIMVWSDGTEWYRVQTKA